jgi:hypothetical protein
MKRQSQKPIETLESQCFEERREKHSATQLYRSPQVCLVGKAKRLIAGRAQGTTPDCAGFFYFC